MTLNEFIKKINNEDFFIEMRNNYIADNGKKPTSTELINYILVKLPITQFPQKDHNTIFNLLEMHLKEDDEWDDTEMRYPEGTPPFIPKMKKTKKS